MHKSNNPGVADLEVCTNRTNSGVADLEVCTNRTNFGVTDFEVCTHRTNFGGGRLTRLGVHCCSPRRGDEQLLVHCIRVRLYWRVLVAPYDRTSRDETDELPSPRLARRRAARQEVLKYFLRGSTFTLDMCSHSKQTLEFGSISPYDLIWRRCFFAKCYVL